MDKEFHTQIRLASANNLFSVSFLLWNNPVGETHFITHDKLFVLFEHASDVSNSSVVVSIQMLSSESHEELETLLNMEMKLRLLDLENITIPETPPPVPAEPPNFNFVYDFS